MEGSKRSRKRVLSVEREFEGSRLESQQLAAAYDRVLPGIHVAFAQRHGKSPMLPSAINAEQTEALSYSTQQIAIGGHFS